MSKQVEDLVVMYKDAKRSLQALQRRIESLKSETEAAAKERDKLQNLATPLCNLLYQLDGGQAAVEAANRALGQEFAAADSEANSWPSAPAVPMAGFVEQSTPRPTRSASQAKAPEPTPPAK